jgi:choline dehydrogenase-like flavoprotein
MIIDSSQLAADEPLDATICIIGAGAAGITLACELEGLGKVILLESGGLATDAALTDDFRGSATEPHADPTQFRRAAFGGTTSLWGGRCVPFDPLDFERREYVGISGWPISYQDLAAHYPGALAYCDAGRFDFTASGSLASPVPTISGFDGGGIVLDDCIERYSLPTDFGKRYRRRIERSDSVVALLNARCVRLIRRGGEEQLEAVEIVDGAGRRRIVRATVFVLAAGGIETTRLLMGSDPQGAGFGNGHDLLGRFYGCHFENSYGRVVPNGAAVAFDFEKTEDGVYCRRQLRFSPAAQREHHLLNIAFRLHFPNYSDASHGSSVMSMIYLAKSSLVPEYRAILQHNTESNLHSGTLPHVRNVAAGLPQLGKFAFDWVFRMRLARRKLPYTLVANADGSYVLEFNCEQTPLESNRVTLGTDTDRHGLRRVNIAWRVCEADVAAAQRAFGLLREVMNRSRASRLQYDDTRLRERLSRSPPLGGHHIGTTRMAATPRQGVVDTNCALFELRNLYVASSAVFPTGSHANPTLTIVALSIRLAKHLRTVIG